MCFTVYSLKIYDLLKAKKKTAHNQTYCVHISVT